MKQWREQLLQWLEMLNEKIEILASSKPMRHLRIAGGVFWNLILLGIIFIVTIMIFIGGIGAGYFAFAISGIYGSDML